MNINTLSKFEKYALDNYKQYFHDIAKHGVEKYLDKISYFDNRSLNQIYAKYAEDLHNTLRSYMRTADTLWLGKLLQSLEYSYTFQRGIIWFAIEQIANRFVNDSGSYPDYRTIDNQPRH